MLASSGCNHKSQRDLGQASHLDDAADEVQAPRDEHVDSRLRPLVRGAEAVHQVDRMLDRGEDVDVVRRERRDELRPRRRELVLRRQLREVLLRDRLRGQVYTPLSVSQPCTRSEDGGGEGETHRL